LNEAADEALRRARSHLRAATLEGLEAARALVEVAIESGGLAEASDDSLVGSLRRSLDDLIAGIRAGTPFVMPAALAEPLAAALEAEIKRWERRSQTDPDARPVLRAFLGLRELLWEIGLGREPASTAASHAPDADAPERGTRDHDRVQRFDIGD
jgi:hypothetical protein